MEYCKKVLRAIKLPIIAPTAVLLYLFRRSEEEQELLIKLYDVITEHKITHFVIGGALIGAHRNNQLIKYDDDMDIVIFDDDVVEVENLKIKLADSIYTIEDNYFGYALTYKNNRNIRLDMCVLISMDDKYDYKSESFRKDFPKQYVYKNEMYPIKYMKLNNRNITIFQKSKEYLDRTFPNWNKIMHVYPPHYLSNSLCKFGIWFNSVALQIIGYIIGLKYWNFYV